MFSGPEKQNDPTMSMGGVAILVVLLDFKP
jgi:hypothetical protein